MNTNITVLLMVCWFACTVGYAVDNDHSWANKKAEVYFLVDSSASVWINDYRKMLKFVADIVADMDIGEDATRVGLGVYSARHHLYIPLDNQKSKANLEGAITEAPYEVGDTYISRALQGMREEGLSPDITRKGVPLIAVLLTDGMSRHKQLTLDNATMAKRQGIFLFTVGIGSHVDKKELLTIASDPKTDYNMYVQDFDDFESIRHSLSKKMSEVEFLQADKGTCGDQTQVDTVFVYDEAALGDEDTQKMQTFMRYLVEGFSMNSGNARVGVVSKTCRQGDITLGQYVTKEDFSAGLNSNQGPDITSLFRHARQTAFLSEHGARLDALRRLVLIMHKAPRSKLDILREILRAKFAGIEIFVIRLGTDYDKVFITRLATSPDHAMFFDSPDHLLRGKKAARQIFCANL